MATSVAALQVTVGADISGALSGLNKLNSAVGSAGGFFGRAASTAAGFIGGALGLQALQGVAMRRRRCDLRLQRQSGAVANELWRHAGQRRQSTIIPGVVAELRAATPFEFPQLVSASQRMLAFGFSASQVIPLLTDIGNVASARSLWLCCGTGPDQPGAWADAGEGQGAGRRALQSRRRASTPARCSRLCRSRPARA
jgi:hypothetical protein